MTNEEILDQPNTWRGDGRVAGAEPSYVLPAPMQLDAETRLAGAGASRAGELAERMADAIAYVERCSFTQSHPLPAL